MAYADFTLEMVEAELGVTIRRGALFPGILPAKIPDWLPGSLARGMGLGPVSEKARSEFIVAPVLLAVRELSENRISIHSGYGFDVDPARKLNGICDFLLSLSEPIPLVKAPVLAVVEAKKNDIEFGLGQCIAQMVGSRLFNERAGRPQLAIYGCVTTGEDWQFLGLIGDTITIDQSRLFINNVELILGTFLRAVSEPPSMPGP